MTISLAGVCDVLDVVDLERRRAATVATTPTASTDARSFQSLQSMFRSSSVRKTTPKRTNIIQRAPDYVMSRLRNIANRFG
jgi:hypothetical protein